MAILEEIEEAAQANTSSAPEPERHPKSDPYLYHAEMPFTAMYYPLGFPVCVTTNCLEVLSAAEMSWGKFEQRFKMDPIRLQVGVREGGSPECPTALTPRAYQHLITGIADADNFFIADLLRSTSFAWVTAAAVRHPLYLRCHMLESAALSHIANRFTAPIHAACVGLDGRGILLCGDSRAGKSTLSFACARAGWTYVSDDAVFLAHGRKDRRAVGNCHSVRLRPESAALFSEVRGRPLTPRMQGKPSVEIATAELGGIQTTGECEVCSVVFLNRKAEGEPELVPYPRKAAREYMLQHLNGWEPLRREQVASVERIVSAPVFELRYRDLGWAVDRLQRMVREMS